MGLRTLLFGYCFISSIVFFLEKNFAEDLNEEILKLKQRISVLEQKLNKQEEKTAEKQKLNESLNKMKKIFEGISVSAGATFVIQGTHNANGDGLSKNGEDVTDVSYSVDLEIEKNLSDYGKIYLHFEGGNGEGVTDELKLFSNVNADATGDENFDLIEAWYEHYFKSIPLTLTFGKLDATCFIDTNEYANDETTQFLGDIFKNSPVLEFPDDNGPGIRLNFNPFEFLDIEMIVMNTEGDWEDFFDNVFFAEQINFKFDLLGREGNYRIYGWLNNKNHIKWTDSSKTKEKGYGFGLSFDQKITDVLGAFIRYGWQNPKVYAEEVDFSLEQFWSAGIQLEGSFWGRKEDIFAIAFGQIFPSDDYKEVNNFKGKSEKHLEVYYSFKVNDHLTLSPDLQVIWDPYGGDAINGDKTVLVGGLRAQVDF